jgi:hypothetical protein
MCHITQEMSETTFLSGMCPECRVTHCNRVWHDTLEQSDTSFMSDVSHIAQSCVCVTTLRKERNAQVS